MVGSQDLCLAVICQRSLERDGVRSRADTEVLVGASHQLVRPHGRLPPERLDVVVGGQGTNISLKSVEVLFDINIGRWIEKHPTLSEGMYLISDESVTRNWIFG